MLIGSGVYGRILGLVVVLLVATSEVRGDLLGYWSADSTAGQGDSLANDQGNSELDGELVEANYSSDAAGHTGNPGDYAIEFEGFDEDYVVIPATEETFDAITLTAWVNGFPAGDWAGLIVSRDPVQPLYLGFQAGSTDLAYVWNDNAPDTWGWVSGVPVLEEEWTFIALTVDEDQATVYAGPQGGKLEFASNEIDHFEQENFTEWRLAEDDGFGGLRNFAGMLDDVSIWNEALDIDQLMALHTGQPPH